MLIRFRVGMANRPCRTNGKDTNMNKSELTARVAGRLSLPGSEANRTIDVLFDVIAQALADGETVRVSGFGTFLTHERAARKGRNPRTGEPIAIAASTSPAFKAGKALRDAVR